MPLEVATAARWQRPAASPLAPSGLPGDLAWAGAGAAALANAYPSAFSTCGPELSRWLLARFAAAWGAALGPAAERLGAAFAATRGSFEAHAPRGTDPDDDGPPAATLLAAAWEAAPGGARVHLAWVGGQRAVWARGGRALDATEAHTLRARRRRERPDLPAEGVPDVLTRALGPDREPPSTAAWDLAPGDAVVLAQAGPRGLPEVPDDTLAALAGGSARSAADAVLAALLPEEVLFGAVAALRCPAGTR